MLRASSIPRPTVRGFTLIELLAVIAIVAILATIAVSVGAGVSNRAAAGKARAELVVLAGALEEFRRVYHDYPHADDGRDLLAALSGRRGVTTTLATSRRPFVAGEGFATDDERTMLVDPWGNAYVYRYPVDGHRSFELYSAGPDRDPAATDDNVSASD